MAVTGQTKATPRLDDAVFTARFEELFAVAYRVAYRILGDRTEAQDAAAEALARAYSRWKRLLDDPEPWVVRVAANVALDVVRRRKVARAHLPAASHQDPEQSLVDRRLDLQQALLALPRRQREVVVLRFIADLTESSVASVLGISVGTVKSHGARGLSSLRTALGEPEGGQ